MYEFKMSDFELTSSLRLRDVRDLPQRSEIIFHWILKFL